MAGCVPRDIKISEIAKMRDGMGIAWVHCPLDLATRIASAGSVNLGWTMVRVELLRKKPVQCFRCWRFSHVRNNCRSAVDRTGLCFRCGKGGHAVRNCVELSRCAVCAEMNKGSGLPAVLRIKGSRPG